MTSLIFGTKLYQALSAKMSSAFSARLSGNYPSFLYTQRREMDEETAVGYEAAWVGVAQQIRRNKGIH